LSAIGTFRQVTDSGPMCERNLDEKSLAFYSLPRKHAIRSWKRRNVGNCAGSGVHLQQNRAKDAKQSLSFCLSVLSLRAIEFRLQLRQRLGLGVSQDDLDLWDHYLGALCRVRNFFPTTTARPKHSMIPFRR